MMTSFELGLPSNIILENYDTKFPRNLLDTDFDEGTEELPASRSEEEATRQLWFIVKDRMMVSYSKVFHLKSEEEVLVLDKEIQQMHETIPKVLRIRPISESLTETPFIIVTRLYLEFIYLKCLCVLHRRHVARDNAFSTNSCVNAGTRIVSHFVDISKEFSPGGQLYMERWMLTNYTMNDFLLGVMILCLALHICRRRDVQSRHIDNDKEQEIIALLNSSRTILFEKSEASRDARRVSHIVNLLLDNANSFSSASAIPSSSTTYGDGSAQHPGQSGGTEPYPGMFDPASFLNDSIEDLDWTIFDFAEGS